MAKVTVQVMRVLRRGQGWLGKALTSRGGVEGEGHREREGEGERGRERESRPGFYPRDIPKVI